MQCYVVCEGQRFGPFSVSQIVDQVRTGILGPDSLVWHAEMQRWAAVNSVTDLWNEVRRPIFLVPPVVWVLVLVIVGVHAARWLLPAHSSAALTIALSFIPVQYVVSSVTDYSISALTSVFTYFTVFGETQEFCLGVLQLVTFGTLLIKSWGVFRFCGLFVVCVLTGPASFLLLNGFPQYLFGGTDCLIAALQGAALWIQKPEPRSLMSARDSSRRTRISTGELLSLLVGLVLPIADGLVGAESIGALLQGLLFGRLLRRRPFAMSTSVLLPCLTAHRTYPRTSSDTKAARAQVEKT
jgi:membrane associated rhomboid family serine protease